MTEAYQYTIRAFDATDAAAVRQLIAELQDFLWGGLGAATVRDRHRAPSRGGECGAEQRCARVEIRPACLQPGDRPLPAKRFDRIPGYDAQAFLVGQHERDLHVDAIVRDFAVSALDLHA